jgi:serine/threonine-protein kinase HipA
LGVDRDVRVSLAGVQEKLLLTRMPDGAWGRPVDGTPSTHILKPQVERFPHTVAKHLGLGVASVDTIDVDGSAVLVVERYDRVVDPDGTVRRIHQEDFCQALGLQPDKKYEQDAGPTLARLARVLQDVAEPSAIDTLLETVTLNIALGNCDAHGKNFSLLHTRSGVVRLAPLYDLLSTRFYPIDDKLAMYVDSVQKADRVTPERIVNEARAWGVPRARAQATVFELLGRMPEAVSVAAAETPGLPAELHASVSKRVERLRAEAGLASG